MLRVFSLCFFAHIGPFFKIESFILGLRENSGNRKNHLRQAFLGSFEFGDYLIIFFPNSTFLINNNEFVLAEHLKCFIDFTFFYLKYQFKKRWLKTKVLFDFIVQSLSSFSSKELYSSFHYITAVIQQCMTKPQLLLERHEQCPRLFTEKLW